MSLVEELLLNEDSLKKTGLEESYTEDSCLQKAYDACGVTFSTKEEVEKWYAEEGNLDEFGQLIIAAQEVTRAAMELSRFVWYEGDVNERITELEASLKRVKELAGVSELSALT